MDYDDIPHNSSRDTYMIVVLCTLVGLPCFVFLNVLTAGLFLWLMVAAAGIGIMAGFHYLLWGRAFSRQVAGEREEEELRTSLEAEDWPYDDPRPIRRL